MNYEKLDNDQKEMVKYWIEKYHRTGYIIETSSLHLEQFIEKHLTPEPVIEAGFWYKHPGGRHPEWLAYNDGKDGYGFGTTGKWINGYDGLKRYLHQIKAVKATPEEVKSRLIEEAKRRGYKYGNYDCILYPSLNAVISADNFYLFDNSLWHGESSNKISNCVMYKGKWAEIIDDKAEIKEQIKKVRQELHKLESQL